MLTLLQAAVAAAGIAKLSVQVSQPLVQVSVSVKLVVMPWKLLLANQKLLTTSVQT